MVYEVPNTTIICILKREIGRRNMEGQKLVKREGWGRKDDDENKVRQDNQVVFYFGLFKVT